MKQNKSLNLYVLRILVVMTYVCFGVSHQAMAQRLIDQTYMNVQTYSNSRTPVSFNFTNGNSFKGTKVTYLTNGRPTNFIYLGTIFFSNGDRLMTSSGGQGFDSNFNPTTDSYYYLTASGTLYNVQYRNGVKVYEQKMNRNYYIENNCIRFYAEGSYEGGGYSGGSSSYGGSNSNSGSPKVSKKQKKCQICLVHPGKCNLCGGKGQYIPSVSVGHYVKCSKCDGTGACRYCKGTGISPY